jgi:eukaryotic-like serine/threonine-protein kinase
VTEPVEDGELATVAEPVAAPAAAARTPHEPSLAITGPSATKASSATIGSPLEALERDEILRTRRFCLIAMVLVIAGGLATPLLPGDPVASLGVWSAVLTTTLGIIFLFRRTSDPAKFRLRSTAFGFFLPTIGVITAIPYFGAFSPAPVLLILAVYFMGFATDARLAFSVYVVCSLGQLVTASLIMFGVTRDTGLVKAGGLDLRTQWIIQGLIQVVMLCTYLTARMSRRTTLVAVGELEGAVRIAAHREALLLEAREELERALRAGRGRFSNQVIGGYELGEVIGRGAMGEVYAATALVGGATVAIKLLSHASLGNPQHVQRFLRELKTAAEIHSPNVVHVIEVGENPVPYLVMEKLAGKTLSDILRGRRTLAIDRVIDLVHQVGTGLTAAAAAGVIHRDIKPHNLFLHHGTWKILDFGVARLAEHGDTLTAGNVVGTPSYMAPEQARGGTVDYRTDLYALAAVAYRTLTGQPPFGSGEVAETLYRVVHTAPRRPSRLAKLSEDVDLVFAIGLAKLPGLRFGSAGELATAVAQAFDGTLPEHVRERARVLVRGGAWAPEVAAT